MNYRKQIDTHGVITDHGLSELRSKIGIEFPVPYQFNYYATKDTIEHFAIGIDDINPLWRDEEYARNTNYKGIIAPPTFLETTGPAMPRPFGLPGVHSLNAGAEFEFYLPVKMNDKITSVICLSNLTEKPSKFSARSFLQEWLLTYRNQSNEIIATQRRWSIRSERSAARGKGKLKDIALQHYTDEEIHSIWADYDRQEIRGSNPRYWEDVHESDELTPVVKGPLTITDMVAFKIGWGFEPFAYGSHFRLLYMRRHPAAAIKNALGIPDVPERVHWENELALTSGLPAAYDYGPQRGSWLAQLFTNWMGDDGRIKRLKYELRGINIIGDTTWCKGKVTKKYIQDGEHLVDVDCWGVNQRGDITCPGNATIILPSGK
ncbi:MaoC family dehydratase N-terminal domain-containing protein [Chloroflexota bacterium]